MKSPFKFFRISARDFLNDEILDTPTRRGNWASLLSVAKVCNCNGHLLSDFDRELSIVELAKLCKTSTREIKYFIDKGKLIKIDDCWYIKNWPKYQDNYDRRLGKSPKDSEIGRPKPQKDSETVVGSRFNDVGIKITDTPSTIDSPLSASPQAVFVDWFKVQYQNRFKKPYIDSKPDYINAANILKKMNDLAKVQALLFAGWNTPDEKNGFSLAKVCMTVSGFCSVINRIQLEPVKKKTLFELEQERKNAVSI